MASRRYSWSSASEILANTKKNSLASLVDDIFFDHITSYTKEVAASFLEISKNYQTNDYLIYM